MNTLPHGTDLTNEGPWFNHVLLCSFQNHTRAHSETYWRPWWVVIQLMHTRIIMQYVGCVRRNLVLKTGVQWHLFSLSTWTEKPFQREEDPMTLAPPILLLPREIIFSLLVIPSLTRTLGPFLPNPQPTQADLQLTFISQSVYRGSWWRRPRNEKEREKGCDDTSVCIASTLRHLLRCPDLADHRRSLLGMLGEE